MMESLHCDETEAVLETTEKSRLVSRSVELGQDFGTRLQGFERFLRFLIGSDLFDSDETVFFWDSAAPPSMSTDSSTSLISTESVAGKGVTVNLVADGPRRFRAVRDAARKVFNEADIETATTEPSGVPEAARPRFFGGFSFHDGHEAEEEWSEFPGAKFVLPKTTFSAFGDSVWLTVNDYGDDVSVSEVEKEVSRIESEVEKSFREGIQRDFGELSSKFDEKSVRMNPSRETWRKQVDRALKRIETGELTKVVLAQSLRTELADSVDISSLMARLGETYSDCHRFAFCPSKRSSFFGATPERLVSLDGRHLETEALAGSIGRGDDEDEDEKLAEELIESEKDRHEHEVVVDAIRKQLKPFTDSDDVETGEIGVQKLDNVQHLRTPISADLVSDVHVLSVVEALHPTPAVGGLPPRLALRTIRETEEFDRGWYASPVGWFDADGNGSFAVGIRSAVASSGSATLFAGAGIVKDSDPDAEWDEIQLKYKPILDHL